MICKSPKNCNALKIIESKKKSREKKIIPKKKKITFLFFISNQVEDTIEGESPFPKFTKQKTKQKNLPRTRFTKCGQLA